MSPTYLKRPFFNYDGDFWIIARQVYFHIADHPAGPATVDCVCWVSQSGLREIVTKRTGIPGLRSETRDTSSRSQSTFTPMATTAFASTTCLICLLWSTITKCTLSGGGAPEEPGGALEGLMMTADPVQSGFTV